MAIRNLHNIEASAFRTGEYVGYDGRGYVWHVRKVRDKEWVAAPAPNNPARSLATRIRDTTLTALASRLAERRAPAIVEPF
jgi:hypothetical protein